MKARAYFVWVVKARSPIVCFQIESRTLVFFRMCSNLGVVSKMMSSGMEVGCLSDDQNPRGKLGSRVTSWLLPSYCNRKNQSGGGACCAARTPIPVAAVSMYSTTSVAT